jgi:hypothetical protein
MTKKQKMITTPSQSSKEEAEFLLAETIKYCKQRKIFGKPLINDWLKEES